MDKHVLSFRGKAALSRFALDKLRGLVSAVTYCEYVHLLEVREALNQAELEKAQRLLTYGPSNGLPDFAGEYAFTVLPRKGTISPWSSKATNVFETSGLAKVLRVERGVRWYVEAGVQSADLPMDLLHDRMTEECSAQEDFAGVFSRPAPRAKNQRGFGREFCTGPRSLGTCQPQPRPGAV